MANPKQSPTLRTINAEYVIEQCQSVAIVSNSGTTTVTGQGTITLAEGESISFESNGSPIGSLTITPSGTALVSIFF